MNFVIIGTTFQSWNLAHLIVICLFVCLFLESAFLYLYTYYHNNVDPTGQQHQILGCYPADQATE